MIVNKKLVLLGAELLAILILRGIYLWRKDNSSKPAGARVEKVAGRPVYRFPFLDHAPKKKTEHKKEQKPYSWKPNPQFHRKRPPAQPSDSPETQST